MLFSLCSFSAYSHSEVNHKIILFKEQGYRINSERVREIFGWDSSMAPLSNVMIWWLEGVPFILPQRWFIHYHHSAGAEIIEISKEDFETILQTDYLFDIFPRAEYRPDRVVFYE